MLIGIIYAGIYQYRVEHEGLERVQSWTAMIDCYVIHSHM